MNIAVIFAGGIGRRMRSNDIPKQFLEMHKKPIIIYTLEIFNNHPEIDAIVISCVKDWIPHLEKLVNKYQIQKVNCIVPGGNTGQISIYNGLLAAKRIAKEKSTIVLIHDGVRPLINAKLISDNITSVKKNGSAITSSSLERPRSRIAKAPQSFWLNDILNAHKKAQKDNIYDFIDSCTLMKHYGYPLSLVSGTHENIKITTPDDFYIMRALLDAQENAQFYME